MNDSPPPSLSRLLQKAAPLSALLGGYLVGLLLSLILAWTASPPEPFHLRPAHVWNAFADFTSAELPFWATATLLGFCRFPRLSSIPVFFRSLIFGYGSLQFYLWTGKGWSYFLFVLGSALTLLPLCCVAKLSRRQSAIQRHLAWSDHQRYLFRCLYFWGLTLIILFLRSLTGLALR